jgi:Fe2+ or Zn2+ uptake regulation protein
MNNKNYCNHPGCRNHITHPCEKCGRIAGQRLASNLDRIINIPSELELFKKYGHIQTDENGNPIIYFYFNPLRELIRAHHKIEICNTCRNMVKDKYTHLTKVYKCRILNIDIKEPYEQSCYGNWQEIE